MITKRQYTKIVQIKDILGLGDQATLPEIKLAFRLYSKQHHPDIAGDTGENRQKMQVAVEGYQVLLDYCAKYQFPLVLAEGDLELDDEEWWMNRFGQDPLWGKQNL